MTSIPESLIKEVAHAMYSKRVYDKEHGEGFFFEPSIKIRDDGIIEVNEVEIPAEFCSADSIASLIVDAAQWWIARHG